MKFVNSILVLMPVLAFSACKSSSNANSSDSLAASNPESAFNDLNSDREFCAPNEEAGVHTCEKVLLEFMNSPRFKGKELFISCGRETLGFVYNADKGGGATLDPDLAMRLKVIIERPNMNNNSKWRQNCTTGVAPAT